MSKRNGPKAPAGVAERARMAKSLAKRARCDDRRQPKRDLPRQSLALPSWANRPKEDDR